MYSFDQILESKIKTGSYQFRNLYVVGLIEFCDGIENIFMTLLITLLANEWDLNLSQISILGASFFTGMVLGNFGCAFIADLWGRKLTFQIFTTFSLIAMYLASLAQNLTQLLLLRLLFGIVYGVTIPLGQIVISEISVKEIRGRFGLILQLAYVLGKIYLVIQCFYFLEDYSSGNWRGLLKFNCIPLLIALISSFLLEESARFYLSKTDFPQAFKEIERASRMNGHSEFLTQEEQTGLIAWQTQINEFKQDTSKDILSPQFLFVTLLLWGIIIIVNQQNMVIYLLMPFLFQSSGSGFEAMLYLYIGEFLITLVIYHLIDQPSFGGRIGTLFITSIILTLTNLLLYLFQYKFLIIGMLIIKLGTRIIFSIIYIVTCESYPTRLRSKSLGIAQGIGKLSTITAPYLLFSIYYISEYLPFLLFSILQIVQVIMISIYPFDKAKQPLE